MKQVVDRYVAVIKQNAQTIKCRGSGRQRGPCSRFRESPFAIHHLPLASFGWRYLQGRRVCRKEAGRRCGLTSRVVLFTFFISLFTFYISPAISHSDGAPPGYTGGFGEPTCRECHFAGPGGETEISLFDGKRQLAVGETWDLQLRITNPDMQTLGLQAAMREPDGDNHSVTALHWNPNDFKTVDRNGVDYVTHRQPLRAENGEVIVDLQWDVPDYPMEVVLHIALVIGNDDESPLGDDVVVFERTIEIVK